MAAPDGMRITDAAGRILDANPAYCRLLGVSRQELIGKLFPDSCRQDDPDQALAAYQAIFEQRPTCLRAVQQISHADGRTLTVEVTHTSFQAGPRTVLLTFFRDLTESEQQTRRHQAVAELSQSALSGVGYDALFEQAIRCVADVLKADARGFLQFDPDAGRFAPQLPAGSPEFHFLQSVANVLTAALERRRVEEKLHLALAEARQAGELKSRFLTNMSHEIRTPMNGILGTAELLLATGLNPEQREYASIIRTSAEVLLAALHDILDLSRIESGRLELEPVLFDPVETVHGVLDLMSVRAHAKALVMPRRIDADVPRRVSGDQGRVRQVLLNLLGNAIKFTATGSIETSVSVLRSTGSQVEMRFQVRDTGSGIAPEHQARIFDSFTQIDDSTTRRHGGIGVGLAIASHLARLMGGEIGVEAERGKGSTFWFTARFGVAPVAAVAGCVQPKPASRPPSSRILLAEDNPVNRKVACHMLQRQGFAVDAVTNGREALEALEVRPYSVVLMDVQMPEMDGFEATRAIRRMAGTRSRTPILAMTANTMSGDRERCVEVGMDDYIAKPVRPDELRQAVERWLHHVEVAELQQ